MQPKGNNNQKHDALKGVSAFKLSNQLNVRPLLANCNIDAKDSM